MSVSEIVNIGVCVLCGLPGAGKTTLCKYLLENSKKFRFMHVCYDNLIPWIDFSLPDVLNSWKEYRLEVLALVKVLISVLKNKSCPSIDFLDNLKLLNKEHALLLYNTASDIARNQLQNIIFLIDDNMPYLRMRYEYFQIARLHCIGYCTIMVDSSFVDCQERNKIRPIQEIVKQKSLQRINAQMERPDLNKQNWEKTYSIIKVPDGNFASVESKIFNTIQTALENPLEPLPLKNLEAVEEMRLINQKNLSHQADLCLRKLCGDFLKSQENPKLYAEKVNFAKKYILNEIKCGHFNEQEFFNTSNSINQDLLMQKMDVLLKSCIEI